MKKLIISLMLMAGFAASAQSIDHNSNFQINVGGGVHTLLYQPVNGTYNIGFGGLLAVQYQLMFNHYLGIGVGVQASYVNAASTYNFRIMSRSSVHPDKGESYTPNVTFNDWRESQHMVVVSVPVQFMFRAPMSEKAAFQAGYKDIAHFKTGNATPIFGELNDDSFTNLKNFMDKYPDIHVTIVGYTDNTGNLQKNYRFSEARAESIKKMLIERGCDAARIDTYGKGPEDSVADNKTAEGRALNRRIEMTIGRK